MLLRPESPVMSILGKFLAFKTTTVTLLAAGWIRNSIIRRLHLDQCCLWKKVTWWQRETRSSPLPWLLSLSLLGVISLASERGQVSEEERSIPSNSTMTLEETVRKYPLQLAHHLPHHVVPAVPVEGENDEVQGKDLWRSYSFNLFLNIVSLQSFWNKLHFAIGKFFVFKIFPVQCTYMSGTLQKPAKLKAQSL